MAEVVATANDLIRMAKEAMEKCCETDACAPFIVTAVAVNGSIFTFRANSADPDEGFGAHLLVEHVERPGYVLPINFMIVNSQGGASRVVIHPEDVPYLH